MEILVQKFGGTSVASHERMEEVCKIVQSYKEKNKDLGMVLVVSAMGRKGAPYATDTLIGLCNQFNQQPQKREMDILMSCGEIISGTILSNLLNSKGIKSTFLTGRQAGIITDDEYSNARIENINPERMLKELAQNKVVVVAGFQGGTEDGEITTLGRGGSDTSAVAIGKALRCENVEIYTDVDGIMTADPRVEPEAKVLDFISYEEVFQMADKGAKVIHPRAVQLARSGNITLVIKNTLNPLAKGTKIGIEYKNSDFTYEKENKKMTAVAHKNSIAQVRIKSEEEVFTEIINKIEENGISIDMINFFQGEKVFVIDETDIQQMEVILKRFGVEYQINESCAKVTLIGASMTGMPGVMARIVRALSKHNISLLQTSDSNMTISCLVSEENMSDTIHVMHNEFYVE